MRKIVGIFLILNCVFVSAQQQAVYSYGNELKVNMGWLLADGTIEVSYEHFINQESSIGFTVYRDSQSKDATGNFGIGPNLRVYFGHGYGNGFFAEAFGLYYTGDIPENANSGTNFQTEDSFATTAVGFSLGHKWLTPSNNFIFEILGGVGRNLNPEAWQNEFIGRAALSVGFRL